MRYSNDSKLPEGIYIKGLGKVRVISCRIKQDDYEFLKSEGIAISTTLSNYLEKIVGELKKRKK